jgi:hypothetical protein
LLTLFGAMFALIWLREVMSFSGAMTLVLSVFVFTCWAVLPDLHEIAVAVAWALRREARREVAEITEPKFRIALYLYLLVLIAWILLLFEVFLS